VQAVGADVNKKHISNPFGSVGILAGAGPMPQLASIGSSGAVDLLEAGEVEDLPKSVPVELLSGVTHEDCAAFTTDFGTLLDVEDVVPGAYVIDRYGMFWNYFSPDHWTFDDLERDLIYYEARHC